MQSSERGGPNGPSTDDRVGMPTDDPHRQQHLLTALVGGTHPEIYACTGLCIGVKPYAIGDADGAPPAARCPALFPVARRIVAERPPVRDHCVPRAQDRSGRTHSKSPGLRLRHYDAFWHRGRCIHTSGGHRSGPPDDLSDESLRRGTNRSGRKRRQTSRSHSDAHGICCIQREDCPLGLPPGRRAHRPGHWRRRRLPSGRVRVDSICSYRKTFFRFDCLKDTCRRSAQRRSSAMTQEARRDGRISLGECTRPERMPCRTHPPLICSHGPMSHARDPRPSTHRFSPVPWRASPDSFYPQVPPCFGR